MKVNYLKEPIISMILRELLLNMQKLLKSYQQIHQVGEWIWYPAVEVQMWLED
jgi:hypothetical protein